MAGGPVGPTTLRAITSGRAFANIHVGKGANGHSDEGMGVEASVGADTEWQLSFDLPVGSLPTGTGKLKLKVLADAVSGDAKLNPSWASVADGEDPSSATLNAEGTQTLSWSAGNNDDYNVLKVDLDADTLVAGETVVMHIIFETTSWTLNQVSTWMPTIIWE